jgi:hypothetical protein
MNGNGVYQDLGKVIAGFGLLIIHIRWERGIELRTTSAKQ